MKHLSGLAAVIALLVAQPAASRQAANAATTPTAFATKAQLDGFLAKVAKRQREHRRGGGSDDDLVVTGTKIQPTPITNTQEQGVDEGDVVKLIGKTLIVLRRGRLFTLALGAAGPRAIDRIDAYPPGVDGSESWYDELLVAGDRVVVIGYSYGRGGTEINRFRLSPEGRLRFEDSHILRSNDYYSSRNYASRLIGKRLIFYTPLYIDGNKDPGEMLPAMRRWRPGEAKSGRFLPITTPQRVFVPRPLRDDDDAIIDTLHTITSCDVTAPELRCSATVMLGAGSRSFYVSPRAMYLWISDGWETHRDKGPAAFVYRLPLDGATPRAIAARGAPTDQFSFSERAGQLHVLVRNESYGDAMWLPELSDGSVALVRIPLAAFGDGRREVPLGNYRALPTPGNRSYNFQNRFAGNYVLYAANGYRDQKPSLVAAPIDGGAPVRLFPGQGAERLELLGRDAIAIGSSDKGLGFATIVLPVTGRPSLGSSFVLPNADESESRSHAYFYNPSSADGRSGMLGLPVTRAIPRSNDYDRGAAMLFLRRAGGVLAIDGQISGRGVAGEDDDDACVASCTDWYGNARPIFVGNRIYALMGYELVEIARHDGKLGAIARIDFKPPRSAGK